MANTAQTIDRFIKNYYFLSNFYQSEMEYGGIVYQCAEAAFQAQKVTDDAKKQEFANLLGNQAKALGRKVELRSDWEDVKLDIMNNVLYAKFTQNESLKQQLLDTGDAMLIEGNWWGDQYWGVCGGIGENHLGKLLMNLRALLGTSEGVS